MGQLGRPEILLDRKVVTEQVEEVMVDNEVE
jgi:hypothetical protein